MTRAALLIVAEAIVAGVALAGCGGLPAPVASPIGPLAVPQLDPVLAAPCADPVPVPANVTSVTIDGLWASDRAALKTCGAAKQAVVADDLGLRRVLARP